MTAALKAAILQTTQIEIPVDATPNASLSRRDIDALAEARHGDPFAVLGPHADGDRWRVRTLQPGARRVDLLSEGDVQAMSETAPGLFEAVLPGRAPYRLRIDWGGDVQETDDPYRFGPLLSDLDLHLFSSGRHRDLATRLGANPRDAGDVRGVHFAVWAPNASSVSVVGDFNGWDARRHPMRRHHGAGLWEIFVPGVEAGAAYKFALRGRHGEALPWKADPLARFAELPPQTASVVAAPPIFDWSDAAWMSNRGRHQRAEAALSFYEVHVSAWLRSAHGNYGSWDEATDRLVDYVRFLGFSHIELMPIAEHPFGGSWGYQPLAQFAPTSRLGPPEAFARFVDRCHAAGIGVVLDWVPGHFPNDEHGLAQFDGTALYEHADPREGFHQDWNTLIYNYGRHEVRGFLIASALWWLKTFHVDGLRVDAVASMLYRDYSRADGEWVPNIHGGRENLEAVAFLKEMNTVIGEECPDVITIAEESTAWPGVTAPVHHGGLGFAFKWNMGWMHDTLQFFERDPIHRRHHLEDIRFGLVYAFTESYVLPLSHDEVVHGKGSLLAKMPGDEWQKFANLRLLLAMQWTHPGKKLLFMGGEFGQAGEWNVDDPFPWPDPEDASRRGLMNLVRDLNSLYRSRAALHRHDRWPDGFDWVVADDAENTVFAFLRSDGQFHNDDLLVVANMTPVPRNGYRIGVPHGGRWREILNSDAAIYGGANIGNAGACWSEPVPVHGRDHSLSLTLPPLGLLILAFEPS